VDIYTHTALVLLVILLTYLITYFLSMKKYIEYGVEYILAKLERENFIRVEYSGPIKKLITVSETHSELYMENEILKNNVHELEKQLNEARKKVVDKLA
jgi:DNA-binding PadR family transcriptional regulator|tara:strand:- start:5349 stop:5645 length:297 start_codon:yes stop_codon:yes gene_type:complete